MTKAGRKTKYKGTSDDARAVALVKDGRTDKELAASLGIGERTLYEWMAKYPQFSQAIKAAKEKPNIEVEAALYKRALGYDVTEGVVMTDRKTGKQRTVRATKRHIPGDTTAMIFYLKNRVPDRWKDMRHNQHAGKVEVTGTDLSRLTDKELRDLDDLLEKAEQADDAPNST